MTESEYKNVWSYGQYLIARHRVAQFPARCLICGEENGSMPLSCTVHKRPGPLQLVMFLGIFSPSVIIRPFFCTMHRKEELQSRWMGHSILLLAISMMVIPLVVWYAIGTFSRDLGLVFTVGWLLCGVWVYYRIFRRRIVYAEYIKQSDVWIQGVHQSVMEQITALPYPAAE